MFFSPDQKSLKISNQLGGSKGDKSVLNKVWKPWTLEERKAFYDKKMLCLLEGNGHVEGIPENGKYEIGGTKEQREINITKLIMSMWNVSKNGYLLPVKAMINSNEEFSVTETLDFVIYYATIKIEEAKETGKYKEDFLLDLIDQLMDVMELKEKDDPSYMIESAEKLKENTIIVFWIRLCNCIDRIIVQLINERVVCPDINIILKEFTSRPYLEKNGNSVYGTFGITRSGSQLFDRMIGKVSKIATCNGETPSGKSDLVKINESQGSVPRSYSGQGKCSDSSNGETPGESDLVKMEKDARSGKSDLVKINESQGSVPRSYSQGKCSDSSSGETPGESDLVKMEKDARSNSETPGDEFDLVIYTLETREKQKHAKKNRQKLKKKKVKKAEEARLKAEEEARVKAKEEEARLKAEEEARLKAEVEARLKAEEEARLKAKEEEARLKAEEEARVKAKEEEARLKAEEEAKLKAKEEEARMKAEETRVKAEEEEARMKAGEERRKAEEEETKKKTEEARMKAEETKVKAEEEEARMKAGEERRKAEEEETKKKTEEARVKEKEARAKDAEAKESRVRADEDGVKIEIQLNGWRIDKKPWEEPLTIDWSYSQYMIGSATSNLREGFEKIKNLRRHWGKNCFENLRRLRGKNCFENLRRLWGKNCFENLRRVRGKNCYAIGSATLNLREGFEKMKSLCRLWGKNCYAETLTKFIAAEGEALLY
jgi:hypothetical protein